MYTNSPIHVYTLNIILYVTGFAKTCQIRICKNMPNCRFNNYTPVAILSAYIYCILRLLITWNRLLITWSRLLITRSRLLITWSRLLITRSRLLITRSRLLITRSRLLITWTRILITWSRLLVTWNKLLITWLLFSWLIFAHCLFMEDRPMIKMMDNGYLWKTDPWSKWWTMDIYGRPTHDQNDGQWIYCISLK